MDKDVLPSSDHDKLKSSLRHILAERDFLAGWNDMDEVYPGIYLGGVDAARNAGKLKRLGITHVLNASFTKKPLAFSPLGVGTNEDYYKEKGLTNLRFMGVEALDVSGFKINKYFQESSEFIDDAMQNNGKVLVHCFMGVSRSAALVLAYLMMKQGMGVAEALRQVRSKRSIHPNDGFLDQLCQLNSQLYGGDGKGKCENKNGNGNTGQGTPASGDGEKVTA